MKPYLDGKSFLSRLRAEHGRLDLLTEGVCDRLQRSQNTSWYRLDRPEVAAKLSALKEELARHLAEEQRGGCIDEAVCRLPSLSAAARRLTRDSDQLLLGLEQAMQAVEFGSRTEAEAAVDEFIDFLRLHEKHEVELVEQGLNTFLL